MSDLDRLLAAMRGPEPPSEPPVLPAEEEEESEANGPGYVPMLLAAMVLLGIGVVTLSPDREEPTSSSEPAEIRADPEPADDDLPPPPGDGGGPDSVEEQPERKTSSSGARMDPGSGTGAPPAARDPERCLAQYAVEDARYELEVAEGGMVIGLDLIDPVNPDLEGCLRRALLGTMKEGEVGKVNQTL